MIENRSHVLLRDITVRITKGSTPTSYGYAYKKEGIRFIKAENIDSKGIASTTTDFIDEDTHQFLKRSILNADDVLFSIAGTIGRIGIVRSVDLPANTNQALAIIRPQNDIVDSKYLFHFLNSPIIQQQTKKKTAGVGRANISLADLGEFEIWLPSNIESQIQIVAEIEKQFSRLDEAVASLKRIQANLKRYKAAVLKAAVEGKLTEQWRKDHPKAEPADQLLKRILVERRAKWEADELAKMKAKGIKPKDDSWKKKYKHPAGPDTANLSGLPEGWVWTSTGELCDCIVPNRDKPKTFSGDIPWITLPDFEDNTINVYRSKSEMGLSKEETSKYNARLIPKGSVVMSCVGRFGIVGIVQTDIVINQQLHGFLMPTEIVTEYFAYAIKTQVPYMNSISTATTIAYLNKENCNSVPIALPPINEQKGIYAEIERRLSATEELEITIGINLKRAERLRQTILQLAFSGQP